MFLVVVVLGVGYWSQTAANNSDQVRRGNEIAACRGDVFAALSAADAALDQARAEWDLVYGDGLVAVLEGDQAAQDDVVARIPAEAAKVTAAHDTVGQAADAYSEVARMAVEDPQELLDRCRSGSLVTDPEGR
ncbi:MAG TPA: hypothetical protein VGE43_19485 [Acidimicrobiales bacterium]